MADLPPVSILTAEYDPLRDEAEALAGRLRAAGVATIARGYLGIIQGFASMIALTPVAGHALDDLGADLRAFHIGFVLSTHLLTTSSPCW